jgi:hydrogenase expression/formation protein HypD
MVLQQLAEGRCEVENQYGRVVPATAMPARCAAIEQVFELREFFEWRGPGLDRSFRCADARSVSLPSMPSAKFSMAERQDRRSKSCQCGEVLKGVIKPHQCKVFGTACTPDNAARLVDGVE